MKTLIAAIVGGLLATTAANAYIVTVIPIQGSDKTWDGFDTVTVGSHSGLIDWDNDLASFSGTGVVTNQNAHVNPNFIANTNYLQQGFGGTDVRFSTNQDGVAMYLRGATAAIGNAFTFFTNSGPVVISIHDIDHALGIGDPSLALGGYENIGVEISGLSPFTNMLITSGTHPYGVFAPTNYEFNSNPAAAPEISTWAMMGMGFLGLAFAGFRRSKTARAIA